MKASESLQNDQSTATENALRRAVDTTPAFIHTARPDGYIDYFNRGWLDFLGKSLEDVCGWRWTESVHPEDVAELVQKWRAALASGEPLEVESRVRRADGSYRAFLHRKLPLRDEHGKLTIRTAYGEDPEQVIALLVKTATAHPNVTKDPSPDAVLKQFGEDALVFVLGFTTEDVSRSAFVQSDVAVAVNATLREAGIEIPVRQRIVHLEQNDATKHSLGQHRA
jgi:PAS domain S-box-containing protein